MLRKKVQGMDCGGSTYLAQHHTHIPAFGWWKKYLYKFEAILEYLASYEPAWATSNTVLKQDDLIPGLEKQADV